MHILIKFILLGGAGLFLAFLIGSGAIGYLLISHNSPPVDISPATLPRWEELPKVSRDLLIPAIAIIAAVWVLVGGMPTTKVEQKKGRNRKRFDED
ncbi:hypothetical protein QT972_09830 [Microcoleus sp. herbarium7]|uniref:hypothetical protein n=1 Tax=Microcoleus sp. herbarium7 TaxID=3055435 RepID=UPI002FD3952A